MPPIGIMQGIGPENIEGDQSQSGSLVPLQMETYQTPLLDLTQTLSSMEMIPARPGYAPIPVIVNWVIESTTGVQTVVLKNNMGSNLAKTNYNPANTNGPSNVNVNGANPPSLAGGIGIAPSVQLFANTPVLLDITAGAQGTGSFSLMGRLFMIVYWAPV